MGGGGGDERRDIRERRNLALCHPGISPTSCLALLLLLLLLLRLPLAVVDV